MKTGKLILNLALDTIDVCIDVVVRSPGKKMSNKLLKKLKENVQKNNNQKEN